MLELESTVKLANTYGLGIVLAIANVVLLSGLIWWILRNCQKEKAELTKIIHNTLTAMQTSVNQNIMTTNIQMELIRNISETMKEASKYNRQEHEMIMTMQRELFTKPVQCTKGDS